MLKHNIQTMRKAKGLSQEELAIKLHAVRQTVSKWERGLSVPDADMLISLSEIFAVPVSALLGEDLPKTQPDDLKAISEKLEIINLQLAEKRNSQRKAVRWILILLCGLTLIATIILIVLKSPYLKWDYGDPEIAVLGTAIHSFEWLFIRIVPLVLLASIIGIIRMRNRP